ncbi:MAG: AAA family ATPase [Tissierellia bacterium]|nr:AAA family ATPase [Tissierellia bacterium]
MRIYAFRGDFNRSISLYYRLSRILHEDLDVEPQPSTQKCFSEIIEQRNLEKQSDKKTQPFIGRYEEINLLKEILSEFEQDEQKSIFISGEAGIGKSAITDKFIYLCERKLIQVFKSQCYEIEKNNYLKPWDKIFAQIAHIVKENDVTIPPLWEDVITYNFPSFNLYNKPLNIDSIEKIESVKYKVTFDSVYKILDKISFDKKFVIVFDDIQWMDNFSLNLLFSLIPSLQNIMFICTYRDSDAKELETKILPILKNNLGEHIELKRLTKKQTIDFIKEYSSDLNITFTEKNLFTIYKETEGNTLFITESIKLLAENSDLKRISEKTENIIKSRLANLLPMEKKVLDISCMFFDKIELNFLLRNLKEDQFEVLEALESLQDKQLIKEYSDAQNIYYQFTHSKFREYLYMNQSKFIRQIHHNNIAAYLEESLYGDNRDKYLYPGIIYHYSNSTNTLKNLEFSIKDLALYSSIKHELFPSYYDTNDILKDKINIQDSFKKIEHLLDICKDQSSSYINYKMKFVYLKGKYNIKNGDYEKGLHHISEFIDYSENVENYSYRLNGYKQMIFYSIQVNDTTIMNKYLKKLELIINQYSDIKEEGNLYRFKGLYNIKTNNYDLAKEYLLRSIYVFNNINNINNNYILNIAACYNYLGIINKFEEKYEEALVFYKDAIKLCEDNNIIKGLDIFYTEAGQVSYELGDMNSSKNYLIKALKYYEKYETIWGRAIAESYYALILHDQGNYNLSKKHLSNGNKYAQKINDPYSIDLIGKIDSTINNNTHIK